MELPGNPYNEWETSILEAALRTQYVLIQRDPTKEELYTDIGRLVVALKDRPKDTWSLQGE